MKFSIAIVAAAFIAGVAANHDFVVATVDDIQNSVTGLSQALEKFNGTSTSVFHVRDAFQGMALSLNNATVSIQMTKGALPDPQGTQIISILTEAYPNLVAATDKVVAIKPDFKKLQYAKMNLTSLIKNDISDLTGRTMWFTILLVAKVPDKDNKKDAAREVANKYNSKLSATLEQYSDVRQYTDAERATDPFGPIN